MSFMEDLRDKRQKFLDGLEANQEDIKLDIFEDFYPDKAHFIYELLQNAEDTGATEVSFTLSEKSLLFEHNGRLFDEEDVRSITGIGAGTKKDDDDKIGQFGIGFKAVFVYTATPRIWSSTYAFEISDLVMPSELSPNSSIGEHTQFEFPFNSPKKSTSDAFSEVRAGLEEISGDTLLFLSHIESIHWRVDDGTEVSLMRVPHSDYHIELLEESYGKATESSHFLRFTQPVEGLERQYAAIAFELAPLSDDSSSTTDNSLAKRFRIVPARPGRVAVYFTAAKETSGLRFHLHAPLVPELSRASVKDTPANEPLFQQLATLTVQSLLTIRDIGLLSADFLAALPNPNDDLHVRYACIREAIVNAMNEQPLTPTYKRSHAPAKRLLQAPAALKALLHEKDIEVLVDFEDNPLAWAIAATQKNSDIDRFLSGLSVAGWGINRFVQTLQERLKSRFIRIEDGTVVRGPDEKCLQWLRSKPDEWHQKLYALLHREWDGGIHQLKYLCIVRLSTNEYMVGSECYFPAEDVREDSILPRVAIGTYTSGRNRTDQIGARNFLESIGVREVGEFEEVESILKQRYSEEATAPSKRVYVKDLRRFISLVEGDPKTDTVFSDYWIFEREDGKWARPDQVYLDSPYFETELRMFFRALSNDEDDTRPVALADRYLKIGISRKAFVSFAKAAGAHTNLTVEKQSTRSHRGSASLRQDYNRPGVRWTNTSIDTDWTIPDLQSALEHPSEDLSQLIWNTMIGADGNVLKAKFRPNQHYETRIEPSTLVLTLRELSWLPQRGRNFVRPAEASQNLLPEGFAFDPGWPWIKAVRFGEEATRRIDERRTQEEVAAKLGIDDEALDDAKWFARLNVNERQRLKSEHENMLMTDLPDHEPGDQERRAKRARRQAEDAPGRGADVRPRSVSVHRDAVKEIAKPYLRQQYTNEDGVTICQVCKKVLPFKLADGSYFFEAVEFLTELLKRHYQNYLLLCPNHAAMYQHANGAKERMKDLFLDLVGHDLEVPLAGENATVYFTTTHRADLRAIIAAEDTNQPEP